MTDRPTVLVAVNYGLPESDYRVQYARARPELRTIFLTPARPPGVRPEDHVELPFGEGIEWRDVSSFARLAALLLRRRRQIDLVHFYTTKLVLFGPVVAALAGIPSIITVTGFGRVFTEDFPLHQVVRPVYRTLFRLAVALSRAVLFQNTADLDATVRRLPGLAPKARYIGSATVAVMPTDRSAARGRPRVLHVARLVRLKGVVDFVRVAETLAHQAEFVLVGGASADYPELLTLVHDAAERGVLTYMGRLGDDELAKAYDSADIVFFPSYTEGMARVLLEAGVRGVCPVAYDIPANRDLVSTDRGFLVPVGDIDAACDRIRRLVEDRSLLERNATRYEHHIRKEFTTEAFASRMDVVVREAAR